jgi:histidinol phosphatase-like PHP family hydrolase
MGATRDAQSVQLFGSLNQRRSKLQPIKLLDLHVHLKGGLTLDQALEKSRSDGILYGISANCGKGFSIVDDLGAHDFCASLKDQPVFIGMQAEGREWTTMFSCHTAAEFDYVFTDAMTWTDDHGSRKRLWIPQEIGIISDVEGFMEILVERTVTILESEPIDIFANPTYLPEVIASNYDLLWSEVRMVKIIDTAVRHGVAIELNDRYHLPNKRFVLLAKEAGCKFTLGSNNTSIKDLGCSEYGLKMIDECNLSGENFFVPGASGTKAVVRKPSAFSRAY